ncbi:hypothetical protein SKAU_G00293650 [Synaphobranchus kaupii]|uniref:Uncharacterized protein n=1 Tax=Synaphobranchus kaupii TaxID=118154 RepID=A0A9Q1EU90_SYNKA|nr:hypothetical protein SKAU_G00293650 [Synaphobranchus kaupii]
MKVIVSASGDNGRVRLQGVVRILIRVVGLDGSFRGYLFSAGAPPLQLSFQVQRTVVVLICLFLDLVLKGPLLESFVSTIRK